MLTMPTGDLGQALRSFVEERLPAGARGAQVSVTRLRGGLMSDSVVHVTTRFTRADGGAGRMSFVLKLLDGHTAREARLYEGFLQRTGLGLAPALYGVAAKTEGRVHLCLEAITPIARWPWRNVARAEDVLERVSALHALPVEGLEHELGDWSYERELRDSAENTLHELERRASAPDSVVRRSLPAVRRVCRRLTSIRGELQSCKVLGPSVIHGDLHPGNVVVRRRRGGTEPIFIDWARSRIGSPLEDVASWLQWLGFWEPEVRRKHDTLLGAYLRARGLRHTPSAALRHSYWLAAASNCFGGVITYHLAVVAETEACDPTHARSLQAVHDCLRVVRRADAYLLGVKRSLMLPIESLSPPSQNPQLPATEAHRIEPRSIPMTLP